MGSAESTAALYVDVENHNIESGEELHGVIHLRVRSPTPGNQLVLCFRGREKTHWTERHKSGKTHVTVHYGGKAVFVEERCTVFVFTEVIQPGEYSFPFSLHTPSGVASSFEFKSGTTFATIKYKLIASMEGPDLHVDKGKSPVCLKKPFTGVAQSQEGQKVAKISTWCCFAKGEVGVRSSFNKNAFLPGETAVVTVDVNNEKSQLDGTNLTAKISRAIRIRNSSGRSHTINDLINVTRVHVRVPFGQSEASHASKTMEVKVPENLGSMASVHGSLIECEYTLNGEVEMDGCCMCCGDYPRISTPMNISPTSIAKPPPPTIPDDWKPKVMPIMKFAVAAHLKPVITEKVQEETTEEASH